MMVVLALSANACLSFDTYCEEATDCRDGNEADKDACIVAEEAAQDRAELYGCTDEFEAFVECREKDSTCKNDQFVLLNNDCEDELQDNNSCLSDSLPGAPF